MNLTEPRELAPLLEAFLLASGKPQSLERLFELFEEGERDRKSTRLNSSHNSPSRMPSSA